MFIGLLTYEEYISLYFINLEEYIQTYDSMKTNGMIIKILLWHLNDLNASLMLNEKHDHHFKKEEESGYLIEVRPHLFHVDISWH